MTDATAPSASPDAERETFRLAYVPGATPGRWARTWRDRLPDVALELVPVEAADAVATLHDGAADAAILRLPVDKTVLSAIPLYEELPVVVVSRDHLLAATEPDEHVTYADVADDVVWLARDDVLFAGAGAGAGADLPGRPPEPYDDGSGALVEPEPPATTSDAIAWVASGAGVTIVPMSLARLHHRKDVTYRVLDGGPTAPVGLAWVTDRTTDLVEEMVGIVRGRTANSSRGRGARSAQEASDGREALGDGRAASDGGTGRGGQRRSPQPRARAGRPSSGRGARRRRR
ncbi:LysR family transcriptional regulator substrate-binding protein [Isoptericola variabilis]|uniref:LysR substrate-binding protein n=1 Tax=Isoptericola variabilis (strain 225) TaxID=743718 RepID=F6FSM5_ISOV2|nr:LysR family transcriptional regulator substrate-binding protein [Isoptericola variabilis]AEG45187.1 LysR substrate-binding protein [Isoptericola variabilis 225]TWH33998.1 Transcriptional regulator [Isoptericola variabilis J7]